MSMYYYAQQAGDRNNPQGLNSIFWFESFKISFHHSQLNPFQKSYLFLKAKKIIEIFLESKEYMKWKQYAVT